MGRMKAGLVITAIALSVYGLVRGVGADPGHSGANASTKPVASANITKQDNECDACKDSSEHTVRFVTVAPGVQVEVLDWGGTGEPLVLLTGLGDNAHVYDNFAYQFTDRFRVIGITRRGFGRSSQPASGYDLDTRAQDDIAVLDALGIKRANFVGHSIAGTEMFKLGVAYPDRVKKIVTIDGLDNAWGGLSNIPQPPRSAEPSERDFSSIQQLAAASALVDGFRGPLAALCNMVEMDASGRIVGEVTPPEIGGKIMAGLTVAQLHRIKAPMLGIFNKLSPQYRLPYYPTLNSTQQWQFRESIRFLSKWTERSIWRFRRDVKNIRVFEIPDVNHYIYMVEEPFTVRKIREFLLER